MATYIKKLVSLTPAQVKALQDFAKDNPDYSHNNRPSESAVVRDALALFFAQQSDNIDQQPDTQPA